MGFGLSVGVIPERASEAKGINVIIVDLQVGPRRVPCGGGESGRNAFQLRLIRNPINRD